MDDLVKRLRNIGDGGIYEKCEGCEYGEDYPDCVGCTHKAFYAAADAIEKLQGELAYWHKAYWNLWHENRWIPVAERLPDDGVPVQVTYLGYKSKEKGADLLACRYEGMWCYWDGEPCSYDECKVEITHWKPLSKPAEED